jgi:acetyl-CoA synthetase
MPVLSGKEEYDGLYKWSLADPPAFWAHMAKDLFWKQKWQRDHASWNFDVRSGRVHVEWFKGAKTNVYAASLVARLVACERLGCVVL